MKVRISEGFNPRSHSILADALCVGTYYPAVRHGDSYDVRDSKGRQWWVPAWACIEAPADYDEATPVYGVGPSYAAIQDARALETEDRSPFLASDVTPANLEVVRKAACPHLPADPKARKGIPLATGLFDYFPDALCAVAELSQTATDQHHPGEPCHWDRNKSADEADTLLRHFVDRGTIDTDGVRHSAKVAWRALAALQKEIEAAR